MSNFFRVVSGVHAEGGNVYRKGDVFESKSDLSRMNHPPTSIKFEKVEKPTQSKSSLPQTKPKKQEQPAVSTLEQYSEEELRQLKTSELESISQELELDISEVSNSSRYRKSELIQLIIDSQS